MSYLLFITLIIEAIFAKKYYLVRGYNYLVA